MSAIKTTVTVFILLLNLSTLCGTTLAAGESRVERGIIADIDRETTKLFLGGRWYPIAEDSMVKQVMAQEKLTVGTRVIFVLKEIGGGMQIISIARHEDKLY